MQDQSTDAVAGVVSGGHGDGGLCGAEASGRDGSASSCGCVADGSVSQLVEGGLPDEEMLYDLADLFKVFADTTRIRILYALMDTDLCVAGIAAIVGVSQSAVSHQLRILKQAHLVKFRRDGKQVVYSLSDDHVYTVLSQGLTHICE